MTLNVFAHCAEACEDNTHFRGVWMIEVHLAARVATEGDCAQATSMDEIRKTVRSNSCLLERLY